MSVTLPGTGSPVETVNGPNGTDQRQVATIAPRDGTAADSIGGLTEAAPGTDTASAGLNGRLQRIAQRITSMITLWGAATDAKNTATDATSLTFMQVFKQISASVQTIATGGGGSSVTIADGAAATIGTKADAKSTATDTTAITAMSVWKQISASVQALVTGTVLAAGSALIGIVKIGDGTNAVTVKAASTGAPAATDIALTVAVRDANLNGRALPGGSAPVVLNSMTYQPVAASATQQCGATGASGDYLDGVLIIPSAAAAGIVQIKDGSGAAITIFAGGGTTALPTLAPFYVPIGAVSSGGAGGWKIITNANVTAIGIGNFT